jgi:choline dehydrogenase-like flavoprotein
MNTARAIERADVVIVGSGMAGAHLAYALALKGTKALVLEAGPRRTRAESVDRFYRSINKGAQSPYPNMPYAPHPGESPGDYYVQAGPDKFIGAYLRIYGGSTWHWTGLADRLRVTDFRMRTLYGVGEDWPIAYDDLVPYYERAEELWGVSGDAAYTWGSPRKGPYPLPPVPATYLDQMVARGLAKAGFTSALFSHARNSVRFDDRPPCCGNNTCVPICPIAAKYDASIHMAKAEALGTRVLTESLVTFVEVGPDQKVVALRVRRPDGTMFRVEGNVFALACHGIENPRLLLNSKQDRAPGGVANSSGAVGRYLLTQSNQDIWGRSPVPAFPYRGPQQTSGIVEFRDGPFRSTVAAVGTSFLNTGRKGNAGAPALAKELVDQGVRGVALSRRIDDVLSHQLIANASAEILPNRDNRIELDTSLDSAGVPRPRITYRLDDYTKRGLARALVANRKIFAALGATDVAWDTPYLSTAIIGGTTRMGRDPKTSVVDANLVAHDHPNLYLLGASAHVTAPINPPTLTIAATAIRAADHILARRPG